MAGSTNVFTYNLTGDTLVIEKADQVVRLSVVCKQGTVSLLGSKDFKGQTPDPISFSQGAGVTLMGDVQNPLDGITIAAGTGSDIAQIVITTQ